MFSRKRRSTRHCFDSIIQTTYFYDILDGLNIVTHLGFGRNRRLRPALSILREKRQRDGAWVLDRVDPDVGHGTKIHPDPKKIKSLVIEPPSRPSKWITLKALMVLKRLKEAR